MNGDEILADLMRDIARTEHAKVVQKRIEVDRLAAKLNEMKRQAEDDRMAMNALEHIFASSQVIEWVQMGHPHATAFLGFLKDALCRWRRQRFF